MRFRAMRRYLDLCLWRLSYTFFSHLYDFQDGLLWRQIKRRWFR